MDECGYPGTQDACCKGLICTKGEPQDPNYPLNINHHCKEEYPINLTSNQSQPFNSTFFTGCLALNDWCFEPEAELKPATKRQNKVPLYLMKLRYRPLKFSVHFSSVLPTKVLQRYSKGTRQKG